MIVRPFQINNFRIPILMEYPTYDFAEGVAIAEHSFLNGGVVLKGKPRLSSKNFVINSIFLPSGNTCWDPCEQKDVDEFYCQLQKLSAKETKVLFIAQNDKIYQGRVWISQRILRTPSGCDKFIFSLSCTLLDPELLECTNDMYEITECNGCLCPEWIRAGKLKFCDIEKDCKKYKTFFRADFLPEYASCITVGGSALALNNATLGLAFCEGGMLMQNDQAMICGQCQQASSSTCSISFCDGKMLITNSGGGMICGPCKGNPYPEITVNDFSISECCNSKVELYYFFGPPEVGVTQRGLYINSTYIDIPLTAKQLAICNDNIYVGTTFYDLKSIGKLYISCDTPLEISYTNNLNTSDYYAYYRQLNQLI